MARSTMALRASTTHRGKRVSVAHALMLAAYEKATGTTLHINQGRRTLAEQARFYYNYRYRGGVLAARPYPGAPHIKAGRAHHALDINDGIVDRVAAFYKSRGVPVAFNVRGEPWHMDTLNEDALLRAAKNLGGGDPVLKLGRKGPSVVRLKKLLYSRGIRNFSGKTSSSRYNPYFGKHTAAAVKRFQRTNGLRADGVVGSATWRKLRGR